MNNLFDEPLPSAIPKKSEASKSLDSHPSYSAKDIEVLEGLEPVRKRPGMYIGGTDERALHHLAAEVIDNAMDEAVAGYASYIKIHLKKDGTLCVGDNGRGIPVDPHPKYKNKSALEVILTTLHSGGKFSGKAYATSGGLHGVGISVVNALSDYMCVEVARDRQLWALELSRGVATAPLKKMGAAPNRRGTTVYFHPDVQIFGEKLKLKAVTLYHFVRSKAFLQKGVRIRWSCDEELVAGSNIPFKAELHFPGGLSDSLSETLLDNQKICEQLFVGEAHFPDNQGRMEWAMGWLTLNDGSLGSYCNTIPTPLGGTHESGLRAGLNRAIKSFAERAGMKKSASITPDDVMGAVKGLISVFIREPQFQGQTKDRLTNSYVTRLVDNSIKDQLDHWLAQYPREGRILVENIILRAEERIRKRDAKEKARKTATTKLRLPGKLADCSSNATQGSELFLVEGDSAGGSAKQARNRETQAIMPLRGKILNVASASRDKMNANQELSDLEQALGCGRGRACNIENLRYEKIIIMTDADVDGAHIAALLMTYFYREMRPLIQEKRLYLAMPPLYRLAQGSNILYARDDQHKEELMKSAFKKGGKVEISRFKGLGEMAPAQLKETTMSPKTRQLLQVRLDDFRDSSLDAISQEDNKTEQLVEDLMGRKPEKRFEFIQNNATFVDNLDI